MDASVYSIDSKASTASSAFLTDAVFKSNKKRVQPFFDSAFLSCNKPEPTFNDPPTASGSIQPSLPPANTREFSPPAAADRTAQGLQANGTNKATPSDLTTTFAAAVVATAAPSPSAADMNQANLSPIHGHGMSLRRSEANLPRSTGGIPRKILTKTNAGESQPDKPKNRPKTSVQFDTIKYRFLLNSGPGLCLGKDKHQECAESAHRRLIEQLRHAEMMIREKHSKAHDLLIHPWLSRGGVKPVTIDQLKLLGWDRYKDTYLYRPSNVNWAREIWFRIKIEYDCKPTSSNTNPYHFASNWEAFHTKKAGPGLKVSAAVLQAEYTKDVGYFYGLKTDPSFDTEAFSQTLVTALGIPVSVHIAYAGFVDPDGKVLLSAGQKEKNQAGQDKVRYEQILAYHVEVAEEEASKARPLLQRAFNTRSVTHQYPGQIRFPVIMTGGTNPLSLQTALDTATNHWHRTKQAMVQREIHHIISLDLPLVTGHHITVRKILLDVLATDKDLPGGHPFLFDQVNFTAGHTTVVFHPSQEHRVTSVLENTYGLILNYTPLITGELGLTTLELEEFDRNLQACFTPCHVQDNLEVIFDETTGIFLSQADQINMEFAQSQGKSGMSIGGGISVRSEISAYTNGGISTTSTVTKMKLHKAELTNKAQADQIARLQLEMEAMRLLVTQLTMNQPPVQNTIPAFLQIMGNMDSGTSLPVGDTELALQNSSDANESATLGEDTVNSLSTDGAMSNATDSFISTEDNVAPEHGQLADPVFESAALAENPRLSAFPATQSLTLLGVKKKEQQPHSRGRSLSSVRAKSKSRPRSVSKGRSSPHSGGEHSTHTFPATAWDADMQLLNRELELEDTGAFDANASGISDPDLGEEVPVFAPIAEVENEIDVSMDEPPLADAVLPNLTSLTTATVRDAPTVATASSAGPGSNRPAQDC